MQYMARLSFEKWWDEDNSDLKLQMVDELYQFTP